MTLNEIYANLENEQHLLPPLTTEAQQELFPWFAVYLPNADLYDNTFSRKYGCKKLVYDNDYTSYILNVKATLYKHQAELLHLWEINEAQYSPIENVFEEESTIHETDEHLDTITDGERQDTTTIAEKQVNSMIGIEGNFGGSTTTQKVVPFDVETELEVGKTDTANKSLKTRDTENEHTDRFKKGEEITKNKYGQTHEETTHSRHGNIGITTATQIMTESKDFWFTFNFFDRLFDILNNELLEGEW